MSFKQFEKVNWIKALETPSGFTCAISEKSGIVKVTFPNSYHTIMLYKDQRVLLQLNHPEVAEYFAANDASIRNSGENREVKKLNKDREKLVNSILNNTALNDEQKQAMIKLIAA